MSDSGLSPRGRLVRHLLSSAHDLPTEYLFGPSPRVPVPEEKLASWLESVHLTHHDCPYPPASPHDHEEYTTDGT